MNMDVTFSGLLESIRTAHRELAVQAGRAINISLTLRNWLIGCYIAEYELNGQDRADYGEKLLDRLATELANIKNCNRRQLYDYLRLYRVYPGIVRSLSAQFQGLIPETITLPAPIVPTLSAQSAFSPEKLFRQLSYSHLKLLLELPDETQRTFYEVECIRGNWSVRELKRQIGSLYYERSGLSLDKNKLAALAQTSCSSPNTCWSCRRKKRCNGLSMSSYGRWGSESRASARKFLCWRDFLGKSRLLFPPRSCPRLIPPGGRSPVAGAGNPWSRGLFLTIPSRSGAHGAPYRASVRFMQPDPRPPGGPGSRYRRPAPFPAWPDIARSPSSRR